MANIEVTASIRRSAEDIYAYLTDLRHLPEYLPDRWFRDIRLEEVPGQPVQLARLEVRLLGRWWPLALKVRAEKPGELVVHESPAPLAMRSGFALTRQKADRRGPRTALRLTVDYSVPGGSLGRLIDGLLLEREVFRAYDQVIRRLPIALEGPPKSGLKLEEP